jgi:hypothetical protein
VVEEPAVALVDVVPVALELVPELELELDDAPVLEPALLEAALADAEALPLLLPTLADDVPFELDAAADEPAAVAPAEIVPGCAQRLASKLAGTHTSPRHASVVTRQSASTWQALHEAVGLLPHAPRSRPTAHAVHRKLPMRPL